MKLVKQSYEILEQEIPVQKMDDYSGTHFRDQYMENMYKHIERCGRTCYKSTDKITEDSATRFVNGLIKSKHLSVLEHGAIYLKLPRYVERFTSDGIQNKTNIKGTYEEYSKRVRIDNYTNEEEKRNIIKNDLPSDYIYVSTNYRVIVENGWETDLQYLCSPTEYHEKRYTVLLHSCIHVYKDVTRHRPMSFSIESTRYVNYLKERFGKQLKFVKLNWINKWYHKAVMYSYLWIVEKLYMFLVNTGWKPEQAAEVLPQCTAGDVIMSGFSSDWKHVFDLRSDTASTGQPHPLVKEIMTPLRDEFINRKYLE